MRHTVCISVRRRLLTSPPLAAQSQLEGLCGLCFRPRGHCILGICTGEAMLLELHPQRRRQL
jgi:hypothetical protein